MVGDMTILGSQCSSRSEKDGFDDCSMSVLIPM